MASLLQPLSTQVNIVDDQGRPTPQFARLLQKLGIGSGLTSSNGLITLATQAAQTILANKTGATATPTSCSISDILDFVATTRGSLLFRGSTGWQALTPGTSGQVLQANGAGADPTWAAINYASRSAMAARPSPTVADVVYLREYGREGAFIIDLASNWTSAISADTAQGIFVPSTVDATKVYRRIYTAAINAKWFGAVGDGATNDTGAFNVAHSVAATTKAKVYVPGTTNGYLLSGTILAQVPMFGDGQNTVLKTSNATADVIQVGVPDVTIQDLHITSTITRTGGYYVNFNGIAANSNYNSRVERCSFDNWFNGIGFTSAGALNTIRIIDCWLTTNVPLGYGITFNTGAPVIDAVLRDIFITGANSGTQPNRGISLDYIGDILLDHVSTVYCSLGVDIEPTGTHTAEAVFINNCFFDSGGNSGIRIGGGTGTTVNLVQIHNTWSCTNGKGLLINGSGGAIQRVEVVGGYFCNNTSGQGIQASVVQSLDVNGGIFAGNTNGINIAAGVSNFKIRGAKCGTSGLFPVNSNFGIIIAAGASTNFVIEGNDLTGNTGGALSNGATGSTGIIANNLGVNPGPTNTITVGASPFTYTAGYSSETVYVGGGAITGLSVSGQGIGVSTGAVQLGPKQSMTVTYTSAPTMVRSVA